MEFFQSKLQDGLHPAVKSLDPHEAIQSAKRKIFQFFSIISSIGSTTILDDFEKRKLGIFNQLNFFQLVTGILVPVMAFVTTKGFSLNGLYVAVLPAFISLIVLVLNFLHRYQAALLCYFILYPVFTCVIYINGFNLGIELSFILYGILSVFFLQDIGYMLFAVGLSMTSYFVLSIAWKDYRYQLEQLNYQGYLVNHALSIVYIFYGLYLIKRENSDYQFRITTKNDELSRKNSEIEYQKKEILYKAKLLERQTGELNELNQVKDKLFSIISHDLKSPMYALLSVFTNAQKFDLSADEIKGMIPAVITDLSYTTALIENLLQWAKSQMESANILPEAIDISKLVNETVKLLQLQANEKKILVETKTELPVYAWGDLNMISLVIRNLVSNAIKFTPEHGRIIVSARQSQSSAEVRVKDTGQGIAPETIQKINENQFYSTNGTLNESGTGLGLQLCKEFLEKNNGHLTIETEPGSGSSFSFTLPLVRQIQAD